MGFLSNLFGKKKRTLRDLTVDDLTREQLTLKSEQRKLDLEAEKIDRDEGQLKTEYAEATTQTQRQAIARQIQDLRTRRGGLQTRIDYCHKMGRTINGLLVIKQNMEFFQRMGVASALNDMDISEVESFINEATVEGTLQQEKLATLVSQVSTGCEQIGEAAKDSSLDDLMDELDGEVAKKEPVREAPAHDAEMDAVMKDLDEVAARGEQAAGKIARKEPAKRQPERRTAEPEE